MPGKRSRTLWLIIVLAIGLGVLAGVIFIGLPIMLPVFHFPGGRAAAKSISRGDLQSAQLLCTPPHRLGANECGVLVLSERDHHAFNRMGY
jgi:hypothetical protein